MAVMIFLSFDLCPISLVSLPDLALDSFPFVPIFLWKSFTQEHVERTCYRHSKVANEWSELPVHVA